MSRALDAALLAAMNSGIFTPWFELQLIASDRVTVVFSTTDVLDFELDGLTCKVTFHDPDYYNDYYTFRILRGITVAGVPNYITSSNYWPISDRHEKRLRTLEGHVFPNSYFTTPGDVTYHQIIDAVCAEFDLAVVFANPAAAWLDYQFYPTGRTLVLNDAKQFFTILRQKYLIFATDYDEDTLYFYQAIATAPSYPSGYITVAPGKVTFPGHGAYKEKSFLSRDENMTSHTSGGTGKPLHNLGFLPSTAAHPARYWFTDTNDWIIQDIPPNLKYLDFDAISVTFDISTLLMWPVKFREVFNKKLSPSWQWQAKYLDIFGNTEGGTIPSTLEASAPYTPLNVSEFNKNLNTTHNNLQAFANKVDELDCGPAIYADAAKTAPDDDDLFPLVDSDTATHLVRKFSWANLKAVLNTYFATLYNTSFCKVRLTSDQSVPTDVFARVELDTIESDAGNNYLTSNWYGTPTVYRQSKNTSGATHIDDDTAAFPALIVWSKVKWASNAAGTLNIGEGYVTAYTATQITIRKASGADFAASYYYYIRNLYYVVPVSGNYLACMSLRTNTGELAKRYGAAIMNDADLVTGTSVYANGGVIEISATAIKHLVANQKVQLRAKAYGLSANMVLSYIETSTFFSIILLKKD